MSKKYKPVIAKLDLTFFGFSLIDVILVHPVKKPELYGVAGGVIPRKDYDFLYEAGVKGIYGPGTTISDAEEAIPEEWGNELWESISTLIFSIKGKTTAALLKNFSTLCLNLSFGFDSNLKSSSNSEDLWILYVVWV